EYLIDCLVAIEILKNTVAVIDVAIHFAQFRRGLPFQPVQEPGFFPW
ncbi:Uncharacterized protein APZ42_005117, partial [Daphnia magna]